MYHIYFSNKETNMLANEQLPLFFANFGLRLEKSNNSDFNPGPFDHYELNGYQNFPVYKEIEEFEGHVSYHLLGGDTIFIKLRELTKEYPQLINVLLYYYFYEISHFKVFNLLDVLNIHEIYKFIILTIKIKFIYLVHLQILLFIMKDLINLLFICWLYFIIYFLQKIVINFILLKIVLVYILLGSFLISI